MGIGGKLDGQIPSIHGASIPLQPETDLLRTDAIFRQGIGSEIVPLLPYPVASLAHRPGLPPTQFLFRFLPSGLCQTGEEPIDADRMPDMLHA